MLCKGSSRFFGVIPCSRDARFGPRAIGLDVAYQAWASRKRTIDDNQNPLAAPGALNGTYESLYHVGAVNVRVNF